MESISTSERRARLARRHRLAPWARARDPVDAARSVVALHATDPSSVYLSAWARIVDFTVADMDRALYADRSLVKQLAMRRTLFVFPRETLPAALAGAGDRVTGAERRRIVRDVEKARLQDDGGFWLAAASEAVVEALAGGREATSAELREEIPLLAGAITHGEGKRWGGEVPVGPRVLNALSAEGRIVRASNDGAWTASRPRWAAMGDWLGEEPRRPSEEAGVAALVEAWLRAFGPGTEADLKWWMGSTLGLVRGALEAVGAVEVDLDGSVGYVLADDLEETEPVEPWAALLPSLDPTIMGWFERGWYLGEHRAEVFDRNGNAGHTVWWDGRVVGGWRQDADGVVEAQLLEDVGEAGRRAIEAEAGRLSEWLAGTRVRARFPSPLAKSGKVVR